MWSWLQFLKLILKNYYQLIQLFMLLRGQVNALENTNQLIFVDIK